MEEPYICLFLFGNSVYVVRKKYVMTGRRNGLSIYQFFCWVECNAICLVFEDKSMAFVHIAG